MTLAVHENEIPWIALNSFLVAINTAGFNYLGRSVTHLDTDHSFVFGAIIGAIGTYAVFKFERLWPDRINFPTSFFLSLSLAVILSKTAAALSISNSSVTIVNGFLLAVAAVVLACFESVIIEGIRLHW